MESRLYLRRVMCNSVQFGGTSSLTDEEKRRTIISLQGGKTFGRGSKNDVMFVDGADGSDDALKSPQYISRIHARVEHTSDEDNFEQYFLYDSSENGTYINDKKLEKNKRHTISIGESIKFGHRNGSQHVPGETCDQPNAQFAFIVEMASHRDPLFEELGKMGGAKVKVLSESAVTRVMTGDTREPSPVNGGCPENGMPSTSSPAIAAPVPIYPYNGSTIPGQMPSTSRTIYIPSIPKRAPHDATFDDPLTCYVLNANRYNPKYQEAVTAQAMRFMFRTPALRPVEKILGNFLDVHVAYEDMKSKEQKIAVIDNFCKTNRQKEGIEILHSQMDVLADLLVEDEKDTDRIRDLLVKLSTKQPKEPIPSEGSAFERRDPQPGQIYRPIVIHPEHSETDYVDYLRFIQIKEAQARELARRRTEIRDSEIKMRVEIPISDLILNGIDIGRYRQWPYPTYPQFWGNYLSPFRQLEMCPIVCPTVSVITTAPRAPEPEPVAPAVQDVAAVAPPTPRPTPRPMDPAEVDEERHSASSGSTTADNSFRQRTDSVESEIVDVVTTDDDKTPQEQEEKGGTETDTPTPSPEDSEANVEEDPRKSSTPRIDAQSTSSAVVSALPTPMSSPVPKVKTQKASAPEAASPEVTAPIHVETAAPATPSISSPKIATPKAPMIASPEAAPSQDSDEPSTSSKPVDEKKIKTKSAVPSTSNSMPSTSDASKTAQKTMTQKDTGPSRRMKQLDESSADSESEDDDKSKRQKKVRRSTRTAKASSPIPAKRKKVVDDDMDEGSEEVQDESKTTPRGNGNAVRRKTLKRANAEEPKLPRRSMKEKVEVETEEPPKKKRGRKKAEPVAVEDEEPVDPDKEKCGVAGTFCLCIKYEKRKNLQWVSCSDCNQWFHVWCVRLDNVCYGADDKFACCGPHASPEAIECLQGDVHRKWWAMPGKRPVPQSPEPE